MIHSSWSLVSLLQANCPPILCCASPRSLIAIIVYTVEVALPATPPAASSGESATLRLPLSIINDDALQTHAAERPQGRAVLYLFSIEHAEQRWGGGSPGPLSVCVRASSHTWVGGHHHEETDHRVHAFATNLQNTDHELQMRLRNSELMPSICQKG